LKAFNFNRDQIENPIEVDKIEENQIKSGDVVLHLVSWMSTKFREHHR